MKTGNNGHLPESPPFDGYGGKVYSEPNRNGKRWVWLGAESYGGYSGNSIYFDRENNIFIQDFYTWGVADDAEERYHGSIVRSREEVLRITHYPSEAFRDVMGQMPDDYNRK